MPLREMTVERRVFGTINGAVEYHIEYTVYPGGDALPLRPPTFTAAQLLAANGAPSEAVFTNVSGAVRTYGRTLAGTNGTNGEYTHFRTNQAGDDYDVVFRDVPSAGAPIVRFYTLASVRAAQGAPSEADFDAVTDFLVSYGDAAAGYVP